MRLTKIICLVATLLATVMNVRAAEWEKPVPADCTPANGQSYYFYNPYTEKFMGVAGITATLNDNGEAFAFATMGDDWTIETCKGYLFADLDVVGCDGGPSDMNTLWYIERQSTGCYRIRPSKTDGEYTWAQYPDMWMGLSFENYTLQSVLKATDGAIDWYIIAEADYAYFHSKLKLHHVLKELQDGGYDISTLLGIYNDTSAGQAEYDAAIASVEDALLDIRM